MTMAKLTRTQLRQIQNIIKNHMEVLMQIMVGDGSPSPSLMKKLNLPKEITDLVTTAYQYGRLGVIKNKKLSDMSAEEVSKLMKTIKLTPAQKRSIDYSKIAAQQSIDSLTQRLTSSIITMAIQSDITMYSAVKEIVPEALENNTPRYKVIQQLREKTGDMYRDWHRVAHTEMWNAKLQGEAEAIINNESPLSKDGADTLVYKKPAWNACPMCKKLYLMPDGVTPRVFKMSELLKNGTNYGKKQADWQPTVGVLHPSCMCPINVMPKNTEFDQQGNLVYKPSHNNI